MEFKLDLERTGLIFGGVLNVRGIYVRRCGIGVCIVLRFSRFCPEPRSRLARTPRVLPPYRGPVPIGRHIRATQLSARESGSVGRRETLANAIQNSPLCICCCCVECFVGERTQLTELLPGHRVRAGTNAADHPSAIELYDAEIVLRGPRPVPFENQVILRA